MFLRVQRRPRGNTHTGGLPGPGAQLQCSLALGLPRSQAWGLHSPRPTHLNEQTGESGRQLSSSSLNVVPHQEAHAPDPAHCNGDLGVGRQRARWDSIPLPPQSSRARSNPFPSKLQGPLPPISSLTTDALSFRSEVPEVRSRNGPRKRDQRPD